MKTLRNYIETEFKYRVHNLNHNEFEAYVAERVDVESSRSITYVDYYYVPHYARHYMTVPHILRLRVEDGRIELTYKARLASTWTRTEINLVLDSKSKAEDAQVFLESCLNYTKILTVHKQCTMLLTHHTIVTLDSVQAGSNVSNDQYMEIEARNPEISPISRLEDVESVLAGLGAGFRNRIKPSLFEIYTGKTLMV